MNRTELNALLDQLALRGNHVIVHASLSSFGHVEGGAVAVCAALIDAVGDGGTVMMPAFTATETWFRPAPGEPRARPVAFHGDLSVSRPVGAIAEVFRRLPGVLRSNHPTHSFAAWGRHAREVLSTQRDNNPFGPLKKINIMRGHVLLLGTSLQTATVIHIAEERFGVPYLSRGTAVRVNAAGYDERVVLENLPGCSAAFVKLDACLEPAKVKSVAMARGSARKIPVRHLVQLAAALLDSDPYAFVCDQPDCASCAGKRAALAAAETRPPHAGQKTAS
ncbi:MAG: family N-acetyltransferase [Deltaproteobacteria bacterium]|nr:family N-acetyltransferase [Deltaproteobacteria bacterium]